MITRFEYRWYCTVCIVLYVLYGLCTGFETISQLLFIEQSQHGQSIDLLLMKEWELD